MSSSTSTQFSNNTAHVMNHVSASSAPRPFRLADSSSSTHAQAGSQSPQSASLRGNSPIRSLSDTRTKRASMRLDPGSLGSFASTVSSPLASPSTPGTSRASRRQSSIAYFSPSQDVSRSPLAAPSLSRANSARVRSLDGSNLPVSVTSSKRASMAIAPSSADPILTTDPAPAAEERAPLTLVEKHADLLQFIAQKEAKCMELRAQLQTHEEELAHLKSKWERIVGRQLSHASGIGLAGPLPTDGSTNASGAMLDGFKEGMQGAARLLVAGLADLSSVAPMNAPSPDIGPSSAVPKLKTTKLHQHQPTNSTSSISTSPSPVFSRDSTSSIESLSESSPSLENDEKHKTHITATAVASGSDTRAAARSSGRTRNGSPGGSQVRKRLSDEKEKTSESPSSEPLAVTRPRPQSAQFSVASNPHTQHRQQQPKAISSLFESLAESSPPTSISTPSTPPVAPVSDWVKRKWAAADGTNQLRDANRRASTILADVGQRGQSWLATLSSPVPTLAPAPGTTGGTLPARDVSSTVPSPAPSISLLDDDDDPWDVQPGDVLVPDTPTSASASTTVYSAPRAADDFGEWAASISQEKRLSSPTPTDDFDDWNW